MSLRYPINKDKENAHFISSNVPYFYLMYSRDNCMYPSESRERCFFSDFPSTGNLVEKEGLK